MAPALRQDDLIKWIICFIGFGLGAERIRLSYLIISACLNDVSVFSARLVSIFAQSKCCRANYGPAKAALGLSFPTIIANGRHVM
jgi:hypothetical protein